jgi:glycerol-3-phosphate dehydrogenase subunit C
MVCPTGVKIAEINARARADIVEQGKVAARLRLRNNLVARAELLGKVAQPIAPLANAALGFGPARLLMEKMLGIARGAPLPAFSRQRFTTWFRKHISQSMSADIPTVERPKVVYFHGCSTQYYEPRVGKAAIHVFEANGFEVIIPPQNCCGLPLLSNGEFAAARRYHNSNVQHLAPYARQGIPIVGTSTSCTLTLKEEAPELLDMHDEDTLAVARMTYDMNEFLLMLADQDKLCLDFKSIARSIPYHVPCQYRAHRLGRPGVEVLGFIPDLSITESQAACCGIAGTYGYKVEKYGIAMQVGDPLFRFIEEFSAPVVVCDSETCRWQITHATGLPAIHPVELLAAAYGFEPEGALAEVLKLPLPDAHQRASTP